MPDREVPANARFLMRWPFGHMWMVWIVGVRRRTNGRAVIEYSGYVGASQSRNLRLQGALYEHPVKLSHEVGAMLRSGFLLGVSAPAALLTVLVQPVVRDAADRWVPPVPTAQTAQIPLPGMRPVSIALSPTRVAGVQKADGRIAPVAGEAQDLEIKPILRQPPRRMVREGCETALSSLVGPEARRMSPGRCIS